MIKLQVVRGSGLTPLSIPVIWTEFSDGAITCKVVFSEDYSDGVALNFIVDPSTPVKQITEEINLLFSAIAEKGKILPKEFQLIVPYLPYGRADRRFEDGNPSPLEVFLLTPCTLFDRITVNDPHNYEALLEFSFSAKIEVIPQLQCFLSTTASRKRYDFVIAPDNGAVEKAKTIAEYLGVPLLCATKKRDISTGKIVDVTFNENIPPESNVIVCDDILGGGGTFIPLGEKIRSQGASADLYVTHLIGATGLGGFVGLYDNIYNYQIVGKYLSEKDVIDFNNNGIVKTGKMGV